MSLMLERAYDPENVPVLVDLGYVEDKASRDCADRLMNAGVGKSRFSIEVFNRLLVSLPKTKADKIIKRFRFKEGPAYWQCTHSRSGLLEKSVNSPPKGSVDG